MKTVHPPLLTKLESQGILSPGEKEHLGFIILCALLPRLAISV
jgi:hypothetical protein